MLYTNRYTGEDYKFEKYEIINPNLYVNHKIPDDMLIIALYQDIHSTDFRIKNIKIKRNNIIEYNMLNL
jgi:hypothetical protein